MTLPIEECVCVAAHLFSDDADGAADPPPVQRQVPVVAEHAGAHAAAGHVGHPAAVVAAPATTRYLVPAGEIGEGGVMTGTAFRHLPLTQRDRRAMATGQRVVRSVVWQCGVKADSQDRCLHEDEGGVASFRDLGGML